MTDAVTAAEVYVTRRCGLPGGQDDTTRIAWHDGDLFDAFLAGTAWAAGMQTEPTLNPIPLIT